MLKTAAIVAALFFASATFAQQAPARNLDALKFLIGDWTGQGGGDPGQGKGGFSIRADLQGKILVRKSYAEYPATKDRQAYRHDDLMIFYIDQKTKTIRAFYTDNEGHQINYEVSVSSDGKSCRLLGEIDPDAPRYRQTLTEEQPGRLRILFEIAPAGKPDEFAKYIEATAHKMSHE
jgi:hypothetical protein